MTRKASLRATLTFAIVLAASPVWAQLAAPNRAGVAMGHLHYQVQDLEANRRFWMALGGRAMERGPDLVIEFPDVLVVLSRGSAPGGTEGSVVNHVAFRVPALDAVERAGLTVQRLPKFPGVASVLSPEGERIELFENAATNLGFTPEPGFTDPNIERHNRPLTQPVAFHHIHLYVPEGAVLEARDWYARLLGGTPGKRSVYDAVDLPGVNINISAAPKPTVPTRGRRLDHIGFEVRNLEAFCRNLAAAGITLEQPYTKGPDGIGRALLVDPWGTSIELTEGLR